MQVGTKQTYEELMEREMGTIITHSHHVPTTWNWAVSHFSPAPTGFYTHLLSNPTNFTHTVVYDRACFLHIIYHWYSVLSDII